MSFIAENKTLWRKLAMAFFVIAMLGPWGFDQLNVPAQYPCDQPSVRLYGDFCGYPMSGFGALSWAAGGYYTFFAELIKGNITARIPELIPLVYTWIIVLPFFSVLLLLWNKNSRRLQTINLMAWGLACVLALALFILQAYRDQFVQFFYLLWGLWLYVLVAIGAIIFEMLLIRSNTKPGTNRSTAMTSM